MPIWIDWFNTGTLDKKYTTTYDVTEKEAFYYLTAILKAQLNDTSSLAVQLYVNNSYVQ